jgi:integrase
MGKPRGMGSIYTQEGSANLWIKYYRNGRPFRESSGSPSRKVAAKLLKQRIGELANGNFIEPIDRRVTVDELYESLLADYRNNEMASLENTELRWKKRLKIKFGGLRAINVTTATLDAYVKWCREQGLANATINRDLAALKRAFNLAWRSTPRRIKDVPVFPRLKEAAPRAGFVEEPQYRKLASNASELWLRALLATAHAFGFRKDELLDLRVRQINLIDRTIRLDPGTTKNDEGRLVVMTSDVFVLLQACCVGKSADNYVFTRPDGEPVRVFRDNWEALCCASGLGRMVCPECCPATTVDSERKCPTCSQTWKSHQLRYVGLLFHDLRRSAVRNAVRRGGPEVVAMKTSGHKTRSVFDRSNVVSEADLRDAARRIESQNRHSLGIVEPLGQWPTASKLPA